MKKKGTLKDLVQLAGFGLAGLLVYTLVVGIVALLVGLLIASFTNIDWYVAAIISFLSIRMLIEGIDAFSGLGSTRCTSCKRKIKTSQPIKCVECGGAALLKKSAKE